MIDLNGKKFRTLSNSENGHVDGSTTFEYNQSAGKVWATYAGESLLNGHLIGTITDDGYMNILYHHQNHEGEMFTGSAQSRARILANGKISIHEKWQWNCLDHSKGESKLEEL